ncbi:amidohydrolase [Pedobacter psychrophilus]|uniref:Amidohydrolase n=1 Tax=Pedobacter psychrophilus TaxID=1826909 RepID=A0A179DHF7_9SPHI|nr:amidohydrolase family protein [Pedobacter psychrophilus]OAQ39863.1 amidohydrolase [Pedobacter psychrophilus]
MNKNIITTLIFTFLTVFTFAQDKDKWDVEKPTGPSKSVNFSTDEGTYMNVDVSPDGKNIVFDLLGDIYKMPISGGNATLLSGGMAFEVQPRFSPDGKYISYTSDKNSGDNIWVMDADGKNQRAITKENFRLLNNAVWTSDSKYIIARKHFTGTRSLGAGELWMYHIAGGLDGIQLTKRKNDQQDLGEPWVSSNGKYVYYSEDVSDGPNFQYNKDPNTEIYAIKRLNLTTSETEKVAGGSGGAVRPQVSPDGTMMAFVKRDRLKSVLYIQNLNTGEEYPVYNDLSKDQQEAWAIFGVYPNFNWLPDNRTLIFYAKGKIRKVDIITLYSEVIPFNVEVKQTVQDALHFPQKVFSDNIDIKMIRQLVTSPDGKKVVFNAAGFLYIKELPNGKPTRLTNGKDWEFEPSFSADGNYIVFTTWNDEQRGAILKYDFKSKKTSSVTNERGFYYSPKFNNKGNLIVYRKGVGNNVLGYIYGKNPGIYTIQPNYGTPKFISKEGIKPSFNSTDDRIYFQSSESGKKAFKSCDLDGGKVRTLYTSTYANAFIPSPDDKWLAFNELFNVYITPLIATGTAQELSSNNKSLPLKKLTKDAGINIHWNTDSKTLHWTLGQKYFSTKLSDAFAFVDGAPDKLPAIDETGIELNLTLPTDKPTGRIAFKNARIITMDGNSVIENGTIVVNENRIENMGNTIDVNIPNDAKVYDAAGKTIMPGIIDVHAHLPTSPDGVSPQQDWAYYANLAYGITTSHDPSSNTEMVFSQAEMIKAGLMVGPRLYSTGTILYGADGDFKAVINNLDDARSHLRRMKEVGAFSVKSYNQPRREQRQQIIQAARELNMEVVPEGGSTFFTDMSMIADGHTGIEHNIPVIPVYKDVLNFWNGSKTAYTPTLIVSFGSQSGENYWYDRTNVWENEHLLNFIPKAIIDERSRRRTASEYGDYGHIDVSKAVNDISRGGTKINLGAHGQLQGLGAHWELWMLAQGGMKPIDCIKSATINGAEYLGMDKEIGSLKIGKLADLIVLNSNPLDDIRNSENIKYTMVNGRLYDSETMNEIGNREKPKARFCWQISNGENYFVPSGNVETYTFTVPDCD